MLSYEVWKVYIKYVNINIYLKYKYVLICVFNEYESYFKYECCNNKGNNTDELQRMSIFLWCLERTNFLW